MGRFLWFWVGINGAYLVMALVLLIAGALNSRSAPLVTGVIMTAMAVPAIVFGVLPALRPLMLTTEGLRIPGQFRGIREIPFERLAAVGLVYNYTPYTQRPAGWTLYVWDGDQPVAISRWIVAAGSVPVRPGSPRKLIQKRDWTMPLSHENAAYLAETRPGRIASSVFEAAVMRQGVNGPTHANAALKSVRYDPNAVTRLAAW